MELSYLLYLKYPKNKINQGYLKIVSVMKFIYRNSKSKRVEA